MNKSDDADLHDRLGGSDPASSMRRSLDYLQQELELVDAAAE